MTEAPKPLICPGCQRFISGYVEVCPHCGLARPAAKQRWRRWLPESGFIQGVLWLSVVLFALSYLLPLLFGQNNQFGQEALVSLLPTPPAISLMALGWADPFEVPQGAWWLLVTAIFLHGGPLHILFNMLWINELGKVAQKLIQPGVSFFLFLISGVAGNALAIFIPVLANRWLQIGMENHPIVGASGGIFGLLGALIALTRKLPAWQGAGLYRQYALWAGLMLLFGFLTPGVSNLAHLGGLLLGYVLGWILPLQWGKKAWHNLLGWACWGVVALSFGMVGLRFL